MTGKFSAFLVVVTLIVIGLQTIALNLPGQPAKDKEPNPSLNPTQSSSKLAEVPPETTAPQSPGPALPVPLTPIEDKKLQQLVLDTQNAKIPATPADAYAYALSWEEELAKIEGIKNPVVVIWQKSLFLSYTNTNVSDTKVKTEVIRRVEQLEPRFDEVFVSSKPEVRRKLLWVQEKMKVGESLGEVVPELENQFNG